MPIRLDGTNGITNATWTTAGRPSAPSTGQMGYNSTLSAMEFYNGSAWVQGGGLSLQSVQTTGFTAVAGNIYPCNTTSAAFTVTLPASPIAGNQVQIIDYAGTFATNNVTLGVNGNKLNGVASNAILSTKRQSISLVYIDATQGWIAFSGFLDSIPAQPYTATYLSVAGGGGGGGNRGGGGGAGGYLTSTLTFSPSTVYTITVGAGGAGTNGNGVQGTTGANSVLSGTGITTVTSLGGGGGGGNSGTNGGLSGGSGGGEGHAGTGGAGAGTSGQGNNGGTGGTSVSGSGGGGGASAVGSNASGGNGGNGGAGTASSITGSSVTYAGGGGGGAATGSTAGTGGSGGGGNGGNGSATPTVGTVNTGGGGGGSGEASGVNGNGGSGVVILSVPTSNYSGTTTGSPTVTTSGSNTIIKFTASGTYTG